MDERDQAPRRGRDERRVARIASIGIAVFAILATLLVGSGFNVTVLVSMAFVFAASANFPALLLALTGGGSTPRARSPAWPSA